MTNAGPRNFQRQNRITDFPAMTERTNEALRQITVTIRYPSGSAGSDANLLHHDVLSSYS